VPTRPLSVAEGSGAGTYDGTTTATVTLTSGGSPVANETDAFSLNGTSVGTATTNAGGVGNPKWHQPGRPHCRQLPFYLAAAFAGDATYASSEATADVTVSRR